MDSRRQSIASDASTTLSSFVRKRFNGEIPIFGGDVRTGVTEAARAVSNSVQTNLATALLAMSHALVTMDGGAERSTSQISMVDHNQPDHQRYSQNELLKCAELDDDQIRLLLDASIVTTDQANYFKTLIYATRDAVRKKSASLDLKVARESALLAIDYAVRDDELESLLGNKRQLIERYAKLIGVCDIVHVKLIERAFVHDSKTNGRTTNRSLALLGDAALSLMVRKYGYMNNVSVGRVSYLSQRHLSNLALRDVGLKANLAQMIVAGTNTDVTARVIVATTVEAIFGAVYLIGGDDMVQNVNQNYLCVCDFASFV